MKPSQADTPRIHVAMRQSAAIGEGPVWIEEDVAVYWIDIAGQKVFRHKVDGAGDTVWSVPERTGALIPRQAGGFVALAKTGLKSVSADFATYEHLVDPEPEAPHNRFNDAKCDPAGRLWAGTMDDDAALLGQAGLYRFDDRRTWRKMRSGVDLSNGLGWSPDRRTMYHSDSLAGAIFAFDYDDATGDIANERVFARVPTEHGVPDGLSVDAEGGVWLAHWDGWRLTRFAADGKIDRVVAVPAPRVASCAFGGPALDRLYITTAAFGLSDQQLADAPLSGSLLVFEPGVTGMPVTRFRD